jgi:addiction module RelE/StbE family toxin
MKVFKPSKKFEKGSKKLTKNTESALAEKMRIFNDNEFDKRLNNHKLHGEYINCRSINITSDYRLIYRKVSDEVYLLLAIGTHSELYS